MKSNYLLMWNWIVSWIYSNDDEFFPRFIQSNWSHDTESGHQELFLSNSTKELNKYLNKLPDDITSLDLHSIGYTGVRDAKLLDNISNQFHGLLFLNLECIFNRRNNSVSKFRLTDNDFNILSSLPLQAINICGCVAVTDRGIRQLKSLIGIRLDDRGDIKGTFIDHLPNLRYIHDVSGRAAFTLESVFKDKCQKRGIKIISGNEV